ncbi:hypothetical protein WMF39_42385 [Sorangium sp. So ce1504]|uniref:hypothetical protein n=1 Tax=Sorangium sp. So ce1504 TaxID=3133337 RepID=UPI003F647354
MLIIICGALQDIDINRKSASDLLQTSSDHVGLTELKLRWRRLASADLDEQLKHMTTSNISAAKQRSQKARRCSNGGLVHMPLHNHTIIDLPVCV